MKIYNYSICAAAAALLLTACTQDFAKDASEAGRSNKAISFSAQTVDIQEETRSTVAPEALPLTGDGMELWLMPSETPMVSGATRGTQMNSVEALNNFGVSAYRHGVIPTEKTQNEYLTDNNLKPDFFYNLEATKITDTQKFKLTKDFFWPTDDDVLSFFAYAPYGDENVELSAATEEGPQSINFTVDTNVKNQVDLITAQAVSTSHLNTSATPSVELNFTHQLTGIRFVIGDQFLKGWVKSISLKGVYTQGTYTIGEGWTLDDTKKGNFTISYNLDKPVAGDPGEEVSASDEVFMMIPHTFAEDDAATIEVVYNDKYTDYVVSAPLKGQTWKAGKTVTYAITSNRLTTLRIGQIQFATTPEGAPKRIWAAGDKIGMYVVSADGKKLKHKNVPVTFDGANWNIDHTTSEGTIYKLAGESFYFYYPYSNVSNGQPTGYPEQCPELKATAPVFFEGVIDYFDYKKDQSTLANHLATDLQVARAEDDGRASMIKATMLRQVGLARFKFATSKTVYKKIFSNNSQQSSTPTTIAPSTDFVTNKPYLGNNATYFFFTKANNVTTFNSNPSDINHWKEAVNITLAAGEYTTDVNMVTVKDNRDGVVLNTYIYNYTKTGSNTSATIHTFTAPVSGKHKLEVYGAQGGDGREWNADPYVADVGGKGGYTYGYATLSQNQTLYVCIGGKGNAPSRDANVLASGGYNGGGKGGTENESYPENAAGGGGATHIARANNRGTLSSYKNYQGEILIVAGGGGGASGTFPNNWGTSNVGWASWNGYELDGKQNDATPCYGGGGGGTGAGLRTNSYTTAGPASGGSYFGYGQDGYVGTKNNLGGIGGGGGGWFGGTCTSNYTNMLAAGGAGGSGHVNTSYVTNYGGTAGSNSGNGRACITVSFE